MDFGSDHLFLWGQEDFLDKNNQDRLRNKKKTFQGQLIKRKGQDPVNAVWNRKKGRKI